MSNYFKDSERVQRNYLELDSERVQRNYLEFDSERVQRNYLEFDSERIRRNYCCQEIRQMLIYRFSMKELRRIAREQGMPYKRRTAKYDRHVDEFSWFEHKIYDAMSDSIRDSIMKYTLIWFMPCDSINITEEDRSNWNEFEKIIYEIVK